MLEAIYKIIMYNAVGTAKTAQEAYLEAISIEIITIALILAILYLIIKNAIKNGIKNAYDDIKNRDQFKLDKKEDKNNNNETKFM